MIIDTYPSNRLRRRHSSRKNFSDRSGRKQCYSTMIYYEFLYEQSYRSQKAKERTSASTT